eukprot:scaffold3961_cov222-Pinguiococcus_pyrenoidosus.AAC.5
MRFGQLVVGPAGSLRPSCRCPAATPALMYCRRHREDDVLPRDPGALRSSETAGVHRELGPSS